MSQKFWGNNWLFNQQKTPLLKRGKLYLDIINNLFLKLLKMLLKNVLMEHQRKGTVKYVDKKGWLKSYV